MGILDKNLHMNGQGTTYQAFLKIAEAAEKKGDTIANRAVRLVKDGIGLATTSSTKVTGARAAQIANARESFLHAIEMEFGSTAKLKAEKFLAGTEGKGVPLTARTIRAVSNSLAGIQKTKTAGVVKTSPTQFKLQVQKAFDEVLASLGKDVGTIDFAKVEEKALKLIKGGKFKDDLDGHLQAAKEATLQIALLGQLGALLRVKGVPQKSVDALSKDLLPRAVDIYNDKSPRTEAGVFDRLEEFVDKYIKEQNLA